MSILNIKYSIFNYLLGLDQKLFLLINQKLSNPFFDAVLPLFRDAKNWTPLYLFVLYLAIKNYKQKVWLWLLFAIVTVVISDQLSASVIKPLIHRPRPYMDEIFSVHVRLLLNNINRGFSFVSSHATNHFAIAVFFTNTVPLLKKYSWCFYMWAGIICYAQVYVGVHYPIDVLGGAMLGLAVGYATSKAFYKVNFK